MHSLIITAHPSSKGHTHELARLHSAAAEGRGATTLLMDLYDPAWQQEFLFFEDAREMNEDDITNKIKAEIARADELVFISPMWWGTFPARIKNFIDRNLSSNFAYTYKKGTRGPLRLPKGLLKGKKVKVVLTADGPTWSYIVFKPFFTLHFNLAVVRFCGMRLSSFTIIGDMFKRKEAPEELQATLERVIKKIS